MSKKIGILSLLIIVMGFGCKPAPEQALVKPQTPVKSSTTTLAEDLRKKQAAVEYQAMQKAAAVDADFDGLSNDEEKKSGTDQNNADSDGDGLLDGDELKTFKTNPLKADTDGDGKSDGKEIKSGGNPLDSKK